MWGYIAKRLILLPITLFCIVFVNFLIINLAPGEPVFLMQSGPMGEATRSQGLSYGPEDHYLQFREFFGLTRPVFYNNWPNTKKRSLVKDLERLRTKSREMGAQETSELKVLLGDKARYCLPQLLSIASDPKLSFETKNLGLLYFFRGALRFSHQGHQLSKKQKRENSQIAKNALFLDKMRASKTKTAEDLAAKLILVKEWYEENREFLSPPSDGWQFLKTAFFDTRFAKYMQRIGSLDFGVLRNDPERTVLGEVVSRLKYSLTLAILPMIATFILCQLFGLLMAVFPDGFADRALNIFFLVLWALPVFVVAPFLIETVALHHNYPFTDLPFPIRGFTSEDSIYNSLTSVERLGDIMRHITLPLLCLFYGSLAMQTRLSRSVFMDTLHQDFIRTARAKGVKPWDFYYKHVGRNAAIPIITAISGSLGLILGGSVIIESIFEIHGFGKFFYDAILNRDYHVMMFSVLIGSFLTLIGYLVADIMYMFLDPRVNL